MSMSIEAMKLALEAMQQAIEDEEKQEPVTLQVNGIPAFKHPPGDVIDAAFHVSDWAQRNNWTKWRIGYCCSVDCTSPPKREWQGLTDEEITEIRLKSFDSIATNHEVYEAIEAKLREKNNG
tara:strand:+ start:1253 stop:1618 length:366 start_codon:yes stop_codon:yes gene_type:complete